MTVRNKDIGEEGYCKGKGKAVGHVFIFKLGCKTGK